MRKIIWAVMALLLPLTAQAAEPAGKPEKLNLMLEWFVNPDHGPIIIAQQKGFFQQEGVEVTINQPAEPDLPPKLVAAGDVDLAVFYQPSLTLGVAEGLPLAWAGTLVASPLDGLIVLDGSPVKSLKDMKGKTIGFSMGGIEDAFLDAMFKPYGFGAKDIKKINVGWNLSSSLMTGRVDAILGAYRNFELNQLEIHKSKGRMFTLEENGVPPYDELIYIAHQDKANKEAIRRFLRATELGAQFIVNHPEQAWEVFKSYSPDTLDNELNKRAWFDTVSYFSLRPAAKDKGRYQRFAEFLQQSGHLKKTVDLNKMLLDI